MCFAYGCTVRLTLWLYVCVRFCIRHVPLLRQEPIQTTIGSYREGQGE